MIVDHGLEDHEADGALVMLQTEAMPLTFRREQLAPTREPLVDGERMRAMTMKEAEDHAKIGLAGSRTSSNRLSVIENFRNHLAARHSPPDVEQFVAAHILLLDKI